MGNHVVKKNFEEALNTKGAKGVLVISHSESLDPGAVLLGLSQKRDIIAYEMLGIFLGCHKLHRNMSAVFSTYILKTTVALGVIPVIKHRSSWFKIGKYGTNFYCSDYRVLDSLMILNVMDVPFTVSTNDMYVVEGCFMKGIRLSPMNVNDIGVYIDDINRVCKTYFSVREGRFHRDLCEYSEWKNYMYTPTQGSSYSFRIGNMVYYRHQSRMVGSFGNYIKTLSSMYPVLKNAVYENIELTEEEKKHYDSRYFPCPYANDDPEFFAKYEDTVGSITHMSRLGNAYSSMVKIDGQLVTETVTVPPWKETFNRTYTNVYTHVSGISIISPKSTIMENYFKENIKVDSRDLQVGTQKLQKPVKRSQFRKRRLMKDEET
jgi:hypothetical protein